MADWTEGSDKASEVGFKHGPNELWKSPLWRSKGLIPSFIYIFLVLSCDFLLCISLSYFALHL
jgi:hypothetical protein